MTYSDVDLIHLCNNEDPDDFSYGGPSANPHRVKTDLAKRMAIHAAITNPGRTILVTTENLDGTVDHTTYTKES